MLTKQIDLKLENIPYIIYGFVLHNFCEISNIEIDKELASEQMKQFHNNDQVLKTTRTISLHVITEEDELIRNIISNYIKSCLLDFLTL